MHAIFPTPDMVYIFIVDLICGLIDAVLLLRLYYRVYGKTRFSLHLMLIMMTSLFVVSAVVWRIYTPHFRPTALPPVTVLFSLVLLPFFKSSRYPKKILFSTILLAVSSFLLVISDMVITPLHLKLYLLAYVIPHVLFWLVLEIIGFIGRKKRVSIPSGMYLVLGVVAVLSVIIFCGIYYDMMWGNGQTNLHLLLLIQMALLFIDIALFVLYDYFAEHMGMMREKAVLEEQLRLQGEHYREIEAMQSQISRMHHDMKNHLRTAALLYEVGKQEVLGEYLRKTEAWLHSYENVVQSGNVPFDTILSMKIRELTDAGVNVKHRVRIPKNLHQLHKPYSMGVAAGDRKCEFSDSNAHLTYQQVVTIWGNLLDNAKEACMKIVSADRWVEINIAYINEAFVSVIRNPYSGKIAFGENGLPKSTKQKGSLHGIGLQNIQQAVEGSGSLTISTDGQEFTVTVVLYEI